MIISKVIRGNYRHITRADYSDRKPLLDSENVIFPRIGTLQARALRDLLPSGRMLSHREFDSAAKTYRLGGLIDPLRKKGWPIVNHDEMHIVQDDYKPRSVLFTRYEAFCDFQPELLKRVKEFCRLQDEDYLKAKTHNSNIKIKP
jgi:hypothetical protein